MPFIPKNCYIDESKVIQKRKGSSVATYCADDIGWTIEEEEEWNRLLEALNNDVGEKYESTESKSADRANDRKESRDTEEEKEHSGSPKYTPCECGYRDQKVPLASHSDWCGYKKWRLHEDRRKEYNDIRIWF